MGNLRVDTFKQVSDSLSDAVVDLEKAANALKCSTYWSNTSEYRDIIKLISETKYLSNAFKP